MEKKYKIFTTSSLDIHINTSYELSNDTLNHIERIIGIASCIKKNKYYILCEIGMFFKEEKDEIIEKIRKIIEETIK